MQTGGCNETNKFMVQALILGAATANSGGAVVRNGVPFVRGAAPCFFPLMLSPEPLNYKNVAAGFLLVVSCLHLYRSSSIFGSAVDSYGNPSVFALAGVRVV